MAGAKISEFSSCFNYFSYFDCKPSKPITKPEAADWKLRSFALVFHINNKRNVLEFAVLEDISKTYDWDMSQQWPWII